MIYFDYSATTPVDEAVLSVMQPYFRENFGNSASQLHAFGWDASAAVETARKKAAEALHVLPKEIYFTSGATESNNWALQGLVNLWLDEAPGSPIHIISSSIEHNSVTDSLLYLQKTRKVEVDFLPVGKDGRVSIEAVKNAIRPHTKLISLMWVNNELGSLNPMKELSQLTRERKIYLHTDATQAIGKIPLNLENTPVDLLSLSSHKIYGPKGVGLLYIRHKNPKVQIHPLFFGGGQEHGSRSGTVNVPGVVGLGKALELVQENIESEFQKSWEQRKNFLQALSQAGVDYHLNGPETETAPQILNLSMRNLPTPGVQLPGIAISKGSACHSEKPEPSQVLKAIGLNNEDAENSIRISFGRMSTAEDFTQLVQSLKKLVGR